jgi:hypothetical protein
VDRERSNSDADKEKLRPRMEEENITWRSFWNGLKGPRPTLYVIDHNGVIRAKSVGFNKELIDGAIEEWVAIAEKEQQREH